MSDDPFADDSDKTVLKPRAEAIPQPAAGATATLPDTLLSGINPLENAASRLLSILVTIKTASTHPAPNQLRNEISKEIEQFRNKAKTLVDDPKQLTMASYILCTALDEAAFNTPWGHNSDWPQNCLLSTFHGEVRGGERFFELLKRLGASPHENIDILELMYVVLSLGYEGTYKIAENGQATLVKVRKWLFEILRNSGRAAPATLSTHWKGAEMGERTLPRLTSLWLMLAVAAAICAVTLVSLQIKLGERAQATIGTFLGVKSQPLTAKTPPPPPPPDPVARPTMTDLLAAEVSAGQLGVIESGDRALVRLFGDNLFGSGRSDLSAPAVPMVNQVAGALNRYQGSVLITGHTDNIPIRKPEFPSNLDLSEARAVSVLKILQQTVSNPDRLIAEGVGDLQPLNDNSTKELRAKNRRVEITVFY